MLISIAIFLCIVLITMRNTVLGISLSIAIRILIPSFVRTPFLSLNASIDIAILFIVICKYLLYHKRFIIQKNTLISVIITYIVFTLLLALVNGGLPLSIRLPAWLKTLTIDFLPAILLYLCIRTDEQIQNVLYTIYGSIFIAGLYGIISYLIIANPYVSFLTLIFDAPVDYTIMIEEVRGALHGRTQGTLSHPLVWGQIVNVLSLFLLMVREKTNKWMFITLYGILLINVVLCGSRAILLANLIGLVIAFFQNSLKKVLLTMIAGYIVIISVISVLKDDPQYSIYVETIEATVFFWDQSKSENLGIHGSSVEMREEQLYGAFDLIKNNFLIGLGQGWINDNYQKHGLHPVMLGFESIIYRQLVENGILGLIAWFIFYFQLYVKTKNVTRKTCKLNIIFWPYLVSLIMTDSFESFYLFLLLLIILVKHTNYKNHVT